MHYEYLCTFTTTVVNDEVSGREACKNGSLEAQWIVHRTVQCSVRRCKCLCSLSLSRWPPQRWTRVDQNSWPLTTWVATAPCDSDNCKL